MAADYELITQALGAAGPNVTWGDLERRRLIASLGATPALQTLTKGDLINRWLVAQGAIAGTSLERFARLYPGRNINVLALIASGSVLNISGTAPDGVTDAPYSFTPVVTGGTGTRVFGIIAGPAGYTFNVNTGELSAEAAPAGPVSTTITVTDGAGTMKSLPVSFNVV